MTHEKENDRGRCGLRSFTRFYAVQTLYRAEILDISPLELLREQVNCGEIHKIFITENISTTEMDMEFFQRLIVVAADNMLQIDEIIGTRLSYSWKMDRLDRVMRAVIRLGTAELLYIEETPPRVVFSEYIEISKSFFEKKDVAFVNGLLNSILN
ncbi:MAG: transcription antitermination factor NusB [Holosporaceae bacterium]|jgi:N utilization substance protein B|nr:transcription antitermination factor NusB [Holosporaceae bacterium]